MNCSQDLVSLTKKPNRQLTFLADIPPKLQHVSAEKTVQYAFPSRIQHHILLSMNAQNV